MTMPLSPVPSATTQARQTQTGAVVAAANTPPRDLLTMLVIGVVVITALYVGRDIILPIVLAIILAFVLTPIVSFFRRFSIPRAPAVILAVSFALALLTTLAFLMTSQISQLAGDIPRYEATIQQKVAGVQQGVLGRMSAMVGKLGKRFERTTEPKTSPEDVDRAEQTRPMPVELFTPDLTPLQLAQRFILPALHPLATFAITFVVLIFIMLQREDMRDRVIRLLGSRDLHRTTMAMDNAASRLSRYFLTQVVLSAGYGVLTAAFLWIIGVPSPILWGVLAAAMRFVPYVGAIIAAIFPMALAMAVDPGWTTLLLTTAFFMIGESTMGYIVEPLVYGQSTGLSSFAVILSTIFWSWLWGPIGLILAMPLTLCLVVLGRHVESFQFLDVILGDTPPLEPSQNFYQRMLAEDPDEALEQAEAYLKERSLVQYYDDVALPGLLLAARDASRGVLKSENLDAIRRSAYTLATDLAATPNAAPHADADSDGDTAQTDAAALNEAWRAEGAILCVAGRGPLDEVASTLLVDVLHKHGFGAIVVPYAAITRGRAGHGGSFDFSNAKLACVTYLELEGAPAHLRYLLRRLRNALPPVAIVAGLWPAGDPIQSDDDMRAHIGADHYVTNVREALAVVLTQAHASQEENQKQAEAAARLDRPLPLP
jgi:predicted PurR-regulated permease PerM